MRPDLSYVFCGRPLSSEAGDLLSCSICIRCVGRLTRTCEKSIMTDECVHLRSYGILEALRRGARGLGTALGCLGDGAGTAARYCIPANPALPGPVTDRHWGGQRRL